MGNNAESRLIPLLLEKKATLATAESCTGGMVGARLTAVSGASGAYKYGAITYCNEAKAAMLGVSTETLSEHGAISAETASEMAAGIRRVMNADIGVSVTGNAGPQAAENKPVGLVFIGVSSEGYSAVLKKEFKGDRASVREQAADAAILLAIEAATEIGE